MAQLARASINAEPINPVAVRLLGLVEEARNDRLALARMRLAERLSRRELTTQLWLMERATQSNDLDGALRHYDTALRTGPASHAILFPILARALDDDQIRAHLAVRLRRNPPWLALFVEHVLTNRQHMANLARTFVLAGTTPPEPGFELLSSAMLEVLVDQRQFEVAREFLAILPRSHARAASSMGFNEASTDARFRPFTWDPLTGSAVGAEFEEGGKALRAFAGSGERAVIMRRYVALPPATYEFAVREEPVEAGPDATRVWKVDCAMRGSDLALAKVDGSLAREPRTTRFTFIVRPGCTYQRISLEVAGGSDQLGLSLLARDLSIKPQNVRK
ncbi:hypothetical protein [Sphingomonas cavernae]|nr:hypothetical protein [Sphingomonas cavernae]